MPTHKTSILIQLNLWVYVVNSQWLFYSEKQVLNSGINNLDTRL